VRAFGQPRSPLSDRKSFDVPFTRPQEVEKIDSTVLAGLRNSEKGEIFLYALFRRCPRNYLAKASKCLYRVLSIVVVPRDSVVIEKREERVAVFCKPLLTLHWRRHS